MHACICTCKHVYVCVCMYIVYVRVCTYIYVYKHVYVRVCMYMYYPIENLSTYRCCIIKITTRGSLLINRGLKPKCPDFSMYIFAGRACVRGQIMIIPSVYTDESMLYY